MEVSITILEATSPLVNKVIELGDANSATLGFLPHGAFKQSAQKKNILVATGPENSLLGYILFRAANSTQIVSITHLCVDEKYRGNGIARQLVDRLKEMSQERRGISLYSRRDYKTNTFWEHMGFVAIGEKVGRGKDKMRLTHYRFDNQRPNLLSLAHTQQIEDKSAHAILDANIVYALYQDPNHPLLADWLLDDVYLCITPETLNEINRNDDPVERELMRQYALSHFDQISHDTKKYDFYHEIVKGHSRLVTPRPQHRSDMKQISYAIAGNAEFFITEDAQLLSNFSEIVRSEFGLKIVRPDDLIISLDELINSAKYQQNRLAGSTMRISRVTAGQSDLLAQTFQAQNVEKKSQFASALRQFLSDPHKYETQVITSPSNEPLAMLVYTSSTPATLEIPVIRVVEKMGLSALASHLIFWVVNFAVKKRKKVVVVTESHLSEEVSQGLQENSFSAQDDKRVKINIPGILNLAAVEQELVLLSSKLPQVNQTGAELINRVAQVQRETSPLGLVKVERSLWPVKLSQAEIPSYLMPIRADWASDLFDPELGKQKLWGSDPNLIFKMDNVYYRAARPKLPQAPSRILWYVSRGKGKQRYQGDMSVRACSYVDEVMIGTPKDLFKRFRKLGVYNWQDVYSTAKENVDQEILAFRFSHTELFDSPIPLEMLKETLGWKSAPQGPVLLKVEQFEKLYRIGFKETGDHEK